MPPVILAALPHAAPLLALVLVQVLAGCPAECPSGAVAGLAAAGHARASLGTDVADAALAADFDAASRPAPGQCRASVLPTRFAPVGDDDAVTLHQDLAYECTTPADRYLSGRVALGDLRDLGRDTTARPTTYSLWYQDADRERSCVVAGEGQLEVAIVELDGGPAPWPAVVSDDFRVTARFGFQLGGPVAGDDLAAEQGCELAADLALEVTATLTRRDLTTAPDQPCVYI